MAGEVPIGGMVLWPTSADPGPEWVINRNQLLNRNEFSALFGVYGETWGEGDGVTTFGIPPVPDNFIKGASDTSPVGAIDPGGSGLSLSPSGTHVHGSAGLGITGAPAITATGVFDQDSPDNPAATAVGPGTLDVNGSADPDGDHIHTVTGSVDPPSVSVNYIIRVR